MTRLWRRLTKLKFRLARLWPRLAWTVGKLWLRHWLRLWPRTRLWLDSGLDYGLDETLARQWPKLTQQKFRLTRL